MVNIVRDKSKSWNQYCARLLTLRLSAGSRPLAICPHPIKGGPSPLLAHQCTLVIAFTLSHFPCLLMPFAPIKRGNSLSLLFLNVSQNTQIETLPLWSQSVWMKAHLPPNQWRPTMDTYRRRHRWKPFQIFRDGKIFLFIWIKGVDIWSLSKWVKANEDSYVDIREGI